MLSNNFDLTDFTNILFLIFLIKSQKFLQIKKFKFQNSSPLSFIAISKTDFF